MTLSEDEEEEEVGETVALNEEPLILGDLGCRNEEGEPVDWWIMYSEPNGLRYLYQDSAMFATTDPAVKKEFRPLRSDRLFTDPVTSPIIRTVYQETSEADNQV